MATSARGDSNNPYSGGLGAGGKFRKRPFRRSQTTPYDRPQTSARNPGLGNINSGGQDGGGGWLSKLVDPAQRLIAYSAHRLFASVFRKRLPPAEAPLQQQQQQEQEQQPPEIAEAEQRTDVAHEGGPSLPMKNEMIQLEDASASMHQSNMTNKDGISELEHILSQKTFTRSEIDRLTTLLRSKTADSSAGKEEQQGVRMNLKMLSSHEKEFPHNLARENGTQNNLISTPVGSRVRDERIASPAELAKAYMDSRPSEVSPSMLGSRSQVVREDSIFLSRTPVPPKLHTATLVPRSAGQVAFPGNGFATPRSRGRSAVYNMARTPYSKHQSAAKVGSFLLASQGVREDTPSGSRQGLKRRSTVLENDIGSVGPVRRIRLKSNLLSSRSLGVPASESTFHNHTSAVGFDSQHASSSKPEVRHNITYTSKESTDNIPSSSLNLVPSKSSEMASKILQQLDKLVSTREKSPTKLSPSMLHGPALKSLQSVDSSKFLENLHDKKSMVAPGTSYEKQDKPEASCSKEFLALPEKPVTAANGTDETVSKKDLETGSESTFLPAMNSMEQHPPKKRAFRMSAHEDFLELDDDHGAASAPVIEQKEKLISAEVKDNIATEEAQRRPLTSFEAKPSTAFASNGASFYGNSNGSMDTARSTEITFAALPGAAIQPGGVAIEPTPKFGSATTEQSNAAPAMFTSGEKVDSLREPSKSTDVFSNAFSWSAATDPLDQKSGEPSNTNLKWPSSFVVGTSDALSKPPDSERIVSNNASEAGSLVSAAPSAKSIFSFGASAASPSPNGGSIGSSASSVFNPMISNLSSDDIASQSKLASSTLSFTSTTATTSVFGNFSSGASTSSNSTSISQSASASSFSAASPFKFRDVPAPASTVPSSSDLGSKEANVKDSSSGNLATVSFGVMGSTVPSMLTSIFADTSSANKSTSSPIFGSASSAVNDAGSNIFSGTSSAPSSSDNASSAPSPAIGSTGGSIFGPVSSSPAPGTSIFSGKSASTSGSSISSSSPALTISGTNLLGGTGASTASSIFGFSAGATSAAGSQSQASNLFGATNVQTGVSASGTAGSTQSAPFQFGSSALAPSFSFSGNTSLGSSNSSFGSSTTGTTMLFSSAPTPQLGSSSLTNSSSSSSTTAASVFGSNWQTSNNNTPVFGSSFNSSTPSFSFGGSSAAATVSSFGSSAATPSSSIFTFNSSAAGTPSQPIFGSLAPPATTPSQPVFGGSAPGFAFGATPPPGTNGNNGDQMNMEDSMAEDTEQTKTPIVPVFGQTPLTPPQPSFAFGASAPPSGPNPFQFASQQNAAAAPQNISPFQASGSLNFNGGGPGGSFSLGSTGGDKSGRRIVKINRNRRTKK